MTTTPVDKSKKRTDPPLTPIPPNAIDTAEKPQEEEKDGAGEVEMTEQGEEGELEKSAEEEDPDKLADYESPDEDEDGNDLLVAKTLKENPSLLLTRDDGTSEHLSDVSDD